MMVYYMLIRSRKVFAILSSCALVLSLLSNTRLACAAPPHQFLQPLIEDWFLAQDDEVQAAIAKYKRGSGRINELLWDKPRIFSDVSNITPVGLERYISQNWAGSKKTLRESVRTIYHLGRATPFKIPDEIGQEGLFPLYRGEGRAGFGFGIGVPRNSGKSIPFKGFASTSYDYPTALEHFANGQPDLLVGFHVPSGESSHVIPIPDALENPCGQGRSEHEFVVKPSGWRPHTPSGSPRFPRVRANFIRGVSALSIYASASQFAHAYEANDWSGMGEVVWDQVDPVPLTNPWEYGRAYDQNVTLARTSEQKAIAAFMTPYTVIGRSMAGIGALIATGAEATFGWMMPSGSKAQGVWSPWRESQY